MPTPKGGYRLKDGTRVPSVTTILDRFKASGGLIHWAWDLAHEPLMRAIALLGSGDPNGIAEFLSIPIEHFDYRAVRDRAADAGTIAHEMVECFIRSRDFDPAPYNPELVKLALPAFEAFMEWAGSTKLAVIETEVPLVSERYRFGGTRDAIVVSGSRAIGDWKTSKTIYPEYLCQLAAYGILDEEQGNKIDGGYHLFRFSKQEAPTDPIRFTHHYWSQLDSAREGFFAMRRLYDVMKQLEKFAA